MSSYGANEAASSRFRSERAHVRVSRPHLVGAVDKEKRARSEPGAEAGERAGTLELSLATEQAEAHSWKVPARRSSRLSSSLGRVAKRAFDISGALLLGIVFLPLMLVIVLFTLWETGSVIYRHRRVGCDGRTFECLKFRTMIPNADQALREVLEHDQELKAEWVRDHKLRNDPRITRFGRFLRRTSLDELPQIWNVIRGDMSLVGPRPVVREELLRYGRNVWAYFAAKPGITGLWQVSGRNDTDYHRRVVLDTYYVRHQNLLLDLYILLKTTRVVLGGSGAY